MIGNDEVLKYLLKKEGFLEEPTNIGDGVFTIGSGLTDEKWHNLYRKRGNVWSQEDNRRAVLEEIQKRRDWAAQNIPNWNILPEASQDALLSYKYNYNFTPTNSPNLYQALQQKDWSRAAKEMDATSKIPKFQEGLQNRREEEQNWFLSGFNKKYKAPVKYKPKVQYVNKNPYNPFPVPQTQESRIVEYTPTRNDSIYGGGARANGGYLFNKGGKKDDRIKELNWPSLSTVDYNVYPDTTFVADSNNQLGYISTITPNQVKKLWGDDVTDYEANRIWYENNNPIGIYVNDKEELINPKFNSNAIIYNPNYANEDAIALDALHIMHDSPIYQELYSQYMDSMPQKYGPLIEAANDEFGDYGISVIEKYQNGIPLTKREQEIVEPIYDALLRRQLAPDYMRNIRGQYQEKAVLPSIPAIGMSGDEAIRQYLESYPLPEINVTNEHSKGGKLNTPLEWEELAMKDRALHIRDAVSRGLYDISDIKKDYNEFKKGGPKKTNTSAKQVFLNSLEKSLKGNSRYNTESWRKYFTELAAVESSYNPNITNNIGAKGYFQLMPFNRASSWNSDVQQFYELYRMQDANMNYFKKNLTKEDLVRANQLGIDIYGLMAGAHLEGAKGALNALRGKNNAKDANGTSVLSYMTRFSQTTPRNVNIEGQMKSLSPYTTVPKEQPVDIYKGIQLQEPMPDIQFPVSQNTVLKENETITGQPIPEVVVTPQKQKVIIPTDTYSDIRELAPALTSTVTPYVIPSVSEKINAMSTDRNTLLQRDLEDSILRNQLLGTYDENKLKKDIEDLRFYQSMSGGNTLATGGDTDTTTSFIRKGTGTPVYLEQDTGYFVDPNTGEKGTLELPEVTVYNDYNHNINGQLRKALPSVFDVTDVSNLAEALGYDPATIKTMADLKKTPQEKGLEIVSPEFAALTLGRAGLNGGLDFLKPGSTFWQNPITQQIAAGELSGRGVDVLTNAMTPYSSFAEGVATETGMPEILAEALNPGYYISPAATTKAIENAVRNTNLGRLTKPMWNAIKPTRNFIPTLKSNMSGIRYAYNRNPELANIGTLEDYNDYLKTVFPESKVRDINYHMGPKGIQELKPSTGEVYNTNPDARGIYVTPDKSYAQKLRKYTTSRLEKTPFFTYIKRNLIPGGWNKANDVFTDIYPVMLDIKNPLLTKGTWTWGMGDKKYQYLMDDYDAVVNSGPKWYQNFNSMPETIVPKTEQSLILGSDADVAGFRRFMSNQQITAENAASIAPEQWTAAQDAVIARGHMAEAPNTLLEQESLIPSFLRRNTETVTPITEESILKDLEAAEAYKESPEYQSLVQSFIEETGYPDIPISIFYNSRKSEIPNIVLESRPEGHLGGYRYTDNKLSIDTSQAKSDVPFHEGLHWQRVGEVPNIQEISPEYKAWAESYWNKAPDDVQLDLFTAYYNSGQYEKLQQQNAAIKDLYKQKVDDVLYEDAVDSELRKPHELIAHTFGTGKALGLKPFQEYPGMQKASEIIEKARNLNGWLRDIKAGTEEEIKKFWKLLTGSYAPSLLIGTSTVGAMGNVNNTEQNGQ